MTITNLDKLIAGLQPPVNFQRTSGPFEAVGVMASLFYGAGFPGPATVPTPGLSGAALTSYAGQLPFTNPSSGQHSYLAKFSATATKPGTLILADRLWHNSGMSLGTGGSSVNSVAWPARDDKGLTEGHGVLFGMEVTTTTTGASATGASVEVVTSEGGASVSIAVRNIPATALAGTFCPCTFATSGITASGARSISKFTLTPSGMGSGAFCLVAYRILAILPLPVADHEVTLAPVGGTGFRRLYDNTVPFLLWVPTVTDEVTVRGQMIVAQG